jgi:hypothetical protein
VIKSQRMSCQVHAGLLLILAVPDFAPSTILE